MTVLSNRPKSDWSASVDMQLWCMLISIDASDSWGDIGMLCSEGSDLSQEAICAEASLGTGQEEKPRGENVAFITS
jgi:hypothetical protein